VICPVSLWQGPATRRQQPQQQPTPGRHRHPTGARAFAPDCRLIRTQAWEAERLAYRGLPRRGGEELADPGLRTAKDQSSPTRWSPGSSIAGTCGCEGAWTPCRQIALPTEAHKRQRWQSASCRALGVRQWPDSPSAPALASGWGRSSIFQLDARPALLGRRGPPRWPQSPQPEEGRDTDARSPAQKRTRQGRNRPGR